MPLDTIGETPLNSVLNKLLGILGIVLVDTGGLVCVGVGGLVCVGIGWLFGALGDVVLLLFRSCLNISLNVKLLVPDTGKVDWG